MRTALVTLALVVSLGAASPAPVAIHVLGTIGHAPADVSLVITVQPNRENRGLWVAIEASGYATAHFEELDVHAPIQRIVLFKQIPSGEYRAYARLIRQHGEISAEDTFIVDGLDARDECLHWDAIGNCLDPEP